MNHTNSIVMQTKAGVKGHYNLKVIDSRNGQLRYETEFDNLITNSGLDKLCSDPVSDFFNYCAVGTGTTAPEVTNTTLAAQVGSRQSDSSLTPSNSGGSPWWNKLAVTYIFNTAGSRGIDGVALAEVGIFPSGSGAEMHSRALILDGAGNPTTITLLDYEVLVVSYSLQWYYDESDHTGVISIGGEDYNYTARISQLGDSSWNYCIIPTTSYSAAVYESQTLGPVTGRPSGAVSNISVTANAYTPGTYYRTYNAFCGISVGNFPLGIGIVVMGQQNAQMQVSFDKVSDGTGIPKTSAYTLSFNEFFKFSVARV